MKVTFHTKTEKLSLAPPHYNFRIVQWGVGSKLENAEDLSRLLEQSVAGLLFWVGLLSLGGWNWKSIQKIFLKIYLEIMQTNMKCHLFCRFLASQDALDVMGVTHSLTESLLTDLTDVTLVSDDTY